MGLVAFLRFMLDLGWHDGSRLVDRTRDQRMHYTSPLIF